jgi:type II secretory pathway component PulF
LSLAPLLIWSGRASCIQALAGDCIGRGGPPALLGRARRDQAGSIFLEVLGMALEVGMPLPEALERAAWSAPSAELRKARRRAPRSRDGGTIPARGSGKRWAFRRFSSQVLLAAAETGNLGSSAIQVARLLREEALARVRRAISIGSTLVYLMAAIVVGYTVIGFYTKLYSTTGL